MKHHRRLCIVLLGCSLIFGCADDPKKTKDSIKGSRLTEISVRDLIAISVAAGSWASHLTNTQVAKRAYAIADAMLQERGK